MHYYCTKQQNLNDLQAKYGDDIEVVGMATNQFMQAPQKDSETLTCFRELRPGGGFEPNFTLLKKGDVNGDKAEAAFGLLRESCSPTPGGGLPSYMPWSPHTVSDVSWNFEVTVFDKAGVPVRRWAPGWTAKEVSEVIDSLL